MLDLQKRTLQLRHKLNLVTTSHECAHTPKEVPRTAAQTMNDGDAMASTPQLAESVQKDILERSQHAVPAMEVSKAKCGFILKSKAASDVHIMTRAQ